MDRPVSCPKCGTFSITEYTHASFCAKNCGVIWRSDNYQLHRDIDIAIDKVIIISEEA